MRISAFNRSCERKQSHIYPSRSLKKVAISFDHDPILFSTANPADEVFGRHTHSGMTTDQFNTIVADWLATTKDKRFKRFYTELVYQPMLELLAYLQANDFKIFIVSGAGQDFIRVFADKTSR